MAGNRERNLGNMPRINIHVLGLIELDRPDSQTDACALGTSGLWQDLVQIGAEPALVAAAAYCADGVPHTTRRWDADEISVAELSAPPAIEANLPRLRRQLDAELDTLVERICAARRGVSS